jgi:hypothetical protein
MKKAKMIVSAALLAAAMSQPAMAQSEWNPDGWGPGSWRVEFGGWGGLLSLWTDNNPILTSLGCLGGGFRGTLSCIYAAW